MALVAVTYSEWCSFNSYVGWLQHCDSFRLYQKYVEPVSNPYVLSLVAVSVWNTLNDPTTKGLGDSARAKSYTAPQ